MFRSFTRWFSDRISQFRPLFRLQIMVGSLLLAVPVIYLMARADSLAAVCVAMAGFGFFRGIYEANTHAALFDVIAPRYRSSSVGVMSMCAMLVGSASPWVLGEMRQALPPGEGLGIGFSSLSAVYLSGALAVAAALFFTSKRE